MTKIEFSGVITALVTPFNDGSVDQKSLVRLVRHQLDQGVDALVVNGTTGESPTLTLAEVRDIFLLVKSEVAGQVPLIVGASSNSTAHGVELAAEISGWGPAALLSVVPYYNRPPQRGLVQHFTQISEAAQVPILLYNVPSRTVTSLESGALQALSQVKNIIGVKDATGRTDILKQVPAEFQMLSGDDSSCVEFCHQGGRGVISVSSHLIAKEMKQFIQRAHHTDRGANTEYQQTFGELLHWLYVESNPIPVKMALYWMGIIASPELRLPLMSLSENYHGEFKACLRKLNLI